MMLGELYSLGWKPKIDKDAFRTLQQEMQKVKEGKSNTLNSWHVIGTRKFLRRDADFEDEVYGNAADIIDDRYGWGGSAANLDFKFWKDLGELQKSMAAAGVRIGKNLKIQRRSNLFISIHHHSVQNGDMPSHSAS